MSRYGSKLDVFEELQRENADLTARAEELGVEIVRLRTLIPAEPGFTGLVDRKILSELLMLPRPVFVSLDGGVMIEWIFGPNKGERRVSFCWDPDEGAAAFSSDTDGIFMNKDALVFLRKWIADNKDFIEADKSRLCRDRDAEHSPNPLTRNDVEHTFKLGHQTGYDEAIGDVEKWLRGMRRQSRD